jgi:hypothetical protein
MASKQGAIEPNSKLQTAKDFAGAFKPDTELKVFFLHK